MRRYRVGLPTRWADTRERGSALEIVFGLVILIASGGLVWATLVLGGQP